MSIYTNLALPKNCYIDQAITKKVVFESLKLKTTEKRLITSDIERITDRVMIRPDTFSCPVYRDDIRCYDEIHILELGLRTRDHIGVLEPLFLQAIPYPIILICCHAKDNQSQYRATAAISRNNQHNAEKNILESTVSTDWLAESDDFWHSLAISHLHTRDLFALYNDFYDSICLRNLRPTYPDADIDRANARALYRAYQQLAEQLDACTAALRRETQFARRLDLVAQIQQIQNRIHELPTQYATSQNECAESVSVRI